ncbi:hypothetical protein K493DRAFT_316178 [Basidiobolus meristosporus CBS 931.73]|uniref:Dystroglycan C-terminal domain-containing protein n=1 Tax=Basidiobolus meristosporus CBS 931.73 TaxID=1314790 RepID=A0A1Y1Y5C9_9FUNG|nr:hypothetical protein K493DRAFT_316178 [Basidiobolus meristosporus CBS 931.73]|eukprot:ORX93095.1 hypothetical protein K493DRAFT_316178 [Basidiobolus meristosporus CBS 931.73]
MRSQFWSAIPTSILLAICSQGAVLSTPVLVYDISQVNKELYKRDGEVDKATPNSSPAETNNVNSFFEEVNAHDITIGSLTIAPLYLAAIVCGVVVVLVLLCVVICCVRSRRAKKRRLEKEVNNSCYRFEDIPSARSNLGNQGRSAEAPRSPLGELLDGEEGYSLSPQRNNSSTMNLLDSSIDSEFSDTSSRYSGIRGKQSKEAAWRLGELKLGSPHQSPPRRYLRDSYRVW